MEPERHEVYERIPWETIDKRGNDRHWLVYAIAGAVVLGALAYSFTRNQPLPTTAPAEVVAGTVPVTPSTLPAPEPTVASPLVVSEADLYAVDPERLVDQAAAHAEWFAVEYLAFDGSEQSRQVLTGLLPAGVPLPSAEEGTQVFVDWAGARSVTPAGTLRYEVEVLVRSLVSTSDSGFVRQPPRLLTMMVEIGEDGVARVAGVPSVAEVPISAGEDAGLVPVPNDVLAGLDPGLEVVGGIQGEDGTWEVVALVTGADGVTRPMAIRP